MLKNRGLEKFKTTLLFPFSAVRLFTLKNHNKLSIHFSWYAKWHNKHYADFVHKWAMSVFLFLMVTGLVLPSLPQIKNEIPPQVLGAASTTQTTFTGSDGTYTNTVNANGNADASLSVLSATYKKQIVFNTSASGANVTTAQTDFPVAIHINTSSWPTQSERDTFFDNAGSTGKRVKFYDSNETTVLAYEVEYFSNVQGSEEALYWVKVPQVDGSTTTDSVYVYYGSDPGSDQDNPTGVWSNGYVGVWHFNSANDSTSSTNNWTSGTPGSGTGYISGSTTGAKTFNGSQDYQQANQAELNLSTNFTVTGWSKYNSGSWYTYASGSNTTHWSVGQHTALGFEKRAIAGYNANTTITAGTWAFGGWVKNGDGASNLQFYLGQTNGTFGADGTQSVSSVSVPTDNHRFGSRVNPDYFNGSADEYRITGSVRTSDWVRLEYFSGYKPGSTFNGDTLINFGSQAVGTTTYNTPGSFLSALIQPTGLYGDWGNVTFDASAEANGGPAGTTLKVQVTSSAGTPLDLLTTGSPSISAGANTAVDVSNGGAGNGFYITTGSTGTIVLTGVSTATYPSLKIKASLATSNSANTPLLNSWTINYSTDVLGPTVPTGLTIGSVTNSTVPLSWTASTDADSGLAGYEVQRAPDSAGVPGTWAAIGSGGCTGVVATNSCTDNSGLSANTKYHYRVKAKDNVGVYSYYFQKTITLDTTASGANVASTQTDFPVAVHVNSSSWPSAVERAGFFDASNTNGKRVKFYSGTTSLSYEVEYYSSGTQEAIYWVKVPSVTGNNTTNISVQYGNDPLGADQDSATGVWDSNYVAVYHMGDNAVSGATVYDSTSNARNLTATGTSTVTANTRQGQEFFATDDVLQQNASTTLGYPFTFSVWAKPDAWPGSTALAGLNDDTGNYPRIFLDSEGVASNLSLLYFTSAGNYVTWRTANPTADGATWTHVVGTMTNTTTGQIYYNGAERNPTRFSGGSVAASGATEIRAGTIGTTDYDYNGIMDEFRISNIARSADYAKLEYYSAKKTNYTGDNDGVNEFVTHGAETASASAYTLATTPTLNAPTTPTNDTTPTVTGSVSGAADGTTVKLYDNGVLKATVTTTGGAGGFTFDNASYGGNTLSESNHTNITARSLNGDSAESPDSNAVTILVDITAPTAPSAATIVAGSGWATNYISNTNKAAAKVSGSKSTDTVQIVIDIDDEDTFASPKTRTLSSLGAELTYADVTGIDVTTVTALNDGNLAIRITASDAAGNTSTETVLTGAGTFKKDIATPTAPSAAAITAGSGWNANYIANANKTATKVSGIKSTDTVQIQIELDDEATYTNSKTRTMSGLGTEADYNDQTGIDVTTATALADGTIYFKITATDVAGNTSTQTGSSFTKDTSDPVAPSAATIVAGSGWATNYISNTNKAAAKVSGSKSTDTVQIVIDIDDEDTFASPKTRTLSSLGAELTYADATGIDVTTATALNDGNLAIRITASDTAGNTSNQTVLTGAGTFKKDTATATTECKTNINTPNQICANYTGWLNANFNIILTSNEAGTTYYKWNDPAFATPLTYAGQFDMLSSIGTGTHTLYYRTIDSAGNGETLKSHTFKLSAIVPGPTLTSAQIDTTQSDPDIDGISTVNSFRFGWNHPGGVTVTAYYYKINSQPTQGDATTLSSFNSCTINSVVYTVCTPFFAAATQNGQNTIYVATQDDGLNVGWSQATNVNFSITVSGGDIAVPENTYTVDSSNRALSDWALTVRWQAPNPQDPNFSNYLVEYSENAGAWQAAGEISSTGFVHTGLNTNSSYSYRIKTKTNFGTTSDPTTATTAKQPTGKYTTPPTIVSGPTATVNATTATVTWSTNRVSSSFVNYGTTTLYGESRGQIDAVTTHTVSLTGLTPGGTYHYRVQSLDEERDYSSDSAYSSDFTLTTQAAPNISSVGFSNITVSSALLGFQTSRASSATIDYGPTTDYGSKIEDNSGTGTTLHAVELKDLLDGTTYQLRITILDIDGNLKISEGHSFKTIEKPKITEFKAELSKEFSQASAKLTWKTNVPTTSIAKYNIKGKGSEKEASQSDLKTTHEIYAKNLEDLSEYEITALGRDQFGNLATSSTETLKTPVDSRPALISDLTIEVSVTGTGTDSKAQVVVSWNTDEPATSQVEYGLGLDSENYDFKTQENAALSTTHVVIIPNLLPSQTYHLRAVVKDAGENITNSENNIVITGSAQESVMSIIIKNIQKSLGWISFVGRLFD